MPFLINFRFMKKSMFLVLVIFLISNTFLKTAQYAQSKEESNLNNVESDMTQENSTEPLLIDYKRGVYIGKNLGKAYPFCQETNAYGTDTSLSGLKDLHNLVVLQPGYKVMADCSAYYRKNVFKCVETLQIEEESLDNLFKNLVKNGLKKITSTLYFDHHRKMDAKAYCKNQASKSNKTLFVEK